MNELIIGGICLFFFSILCFAVDFEENGGFTTLKRNLSKKWNSFKDWWFDVGTAYYKFKAQRARKKVRK